MTMPIAFILFCFVFWVKFVQRERRDPRVWHRAFPLDGDIGDAMVHLLIVDLIRANGHRLISEAPQFLLSSPFDYPALFHKLLSYIPRPVLERREVLILPAIEASMAALVFTAAEHLLSQLAPPVFDGHLLATLVVLALTFTPQFFQNFARMAVLSERPFGVLFANIYLFSVAMLTATADPWWLVAMLPAYAITATASKFGNQAMVSISVGMSVLLVDPIPVGGLAASMLFAVVVSGGYVLTVWRGAIRHSRFYRDVAVKMHPYTRSFSIADLRPALQDIWQGLQGRDLGACLRACDRHPLLALFPRFPWLVPFFLAVALNLGGGDGTSIAGALTAWGIAAILVCVATMTDSLKFLGEGERYLEYGFLPILVVTLLGPPWLALVVCFFISRHVGTWRDVYFRTEIKPMISDAQREMVNYVRALPATTITTIPLRLSFPLCYGTEHKTPWLLANIPGGECFRRFEAFYQRLTPNQFISPTEIVNISDEYGVEILVADKSSLEWIERYLSLEYDFSKFKIIFDNDNYMVVRLMEKAT
ncbi:MAG: hypothetical protein HQL42_02770 [Alphaproteobacteria bacterium]|nr:hypothetical protein [Alphaproteobacteria bacterium]